MTLLNSTNQIQYTANGSTSAFDFPFKCYKPEHIELYYNGVKQITSVYSVTLKWDFSQGTVNTVGNPAAGTIVLIRRNVPLVQDIDLGRLDPLNESNIEAMSDKLTMIAQQHEETMARSIKLPVGSVLNLNLPAPVANYLLGWNATGDDIVNTPGTPGPQGPPGNFNGPGGTLPQADRVVVFNGTNGSAGKDSGYTIPAIIAAGAASYVDRQLWGDGSDGAITIATNTTETTKRVIRATNITINSGVEWIVKSGTIIQCTGTFINNGTLTVAADNLGGLGQQAAYGAYSAPMGPSRPAENNNPNTPQYCASAPGCGGAGGDSSITSNVPQLKGNPALWPYPGVTGTGGAPGGLGAQSGTAGNGGNGGGSCGIFAYGGILNAVGALMRANGTDGTAGTGYIGGGGGVGGTGGVWELGSTGLITNQGTIEAKGGSSGNNSGAAYAFRAAGPGGGMVVVQCGGTWTAGTVSLTGGAAATGGALVTTPPTNGSNGVTYVTGKAPTHMYCF